LSRWQHDDFIADAQTAICECARDDRAEACNGESAVNRQAWATEIETFGFVFE